MRFKKLDLNLLPVLDVLLKTESVSRSAEQMFITQSAMSNALARLRDYFNDPLLVQVGRELRRTPLGDELSTEIRPLILQIETLMERRAGFDPAVSDRSFGIALSDYSLRTYMAGFVAALRQEAPNLTIHLLSIGESPDLLLTRADVQLVIAPREICSDQHPSELLLTDSICCVAARESRHPRTKFSKAQFEAASHVVFMPQEGGESFTTESCRRAGLNINPRVTTFSFESMCDMVNGTDLVGIVQRRLAEKAIADGKRLRIIRPPISLPLLHQLIQWHAARGADPALEWLRSKLREAVSNST